MSGCEAQDISSAGVGVDNLQISAGTATASTAQHRTGAASLRCNPGSGASLTFVLNGASNGYQHFGLYIATMPSVARIIAGNGTGSTLKLNSTGTLEVFDTTTSRGASTTALVTGQWYWIGRLTIAGTSVPLLQINGTTEVTGTVAADGSGGLMGFIGTEASAADIYFDDFIIDGAGFLAPSNVNLALPISDNTVTGVTDNNGVTTNIWQCVSNTPPAGVASANEAANPKKGMHFTASTTDNYIANLTTYTTLGVGASDTVLAVQGIVRHGEDIATGTKNLQNVAALTNPTVAGSSVTAGLDLGAHGAETGLWQTTFGTMTTSPSVTLGSSPTIRTSRTSESRLACVDFMGMYVAWTPAAAAAHSLPPYRRHRGLIVR
jgi:hypothetical protein